MRILPSAFPALLLAACLLPTTVRGEEPKPPKEDPEVEAYFKAQGWKVAADRRLPDFKRMMSLAISDPKQPFGKVKLTDEGYKMLGKAKTVEFLNLMNVECTDDGLKAVAANQSVTSITVGGEGLTDAGVGALAGAKGLENVAITGGDKVTDAGIRELAKLPKLDTLKLLFLKIDGTGLDAFAGSKTLKTLTLYLDGLTDDGAKAIAKLPGLNDLSISRSKVTAAGLKAIVEARLPAEFNFDKQLLDDALLASLVAKGFFYGPTEPGRGDRHPEKPEEVREIAVGYSAVTDRGFAVLLDCTHIDSLHVDNSAIGDATLLKMSGFKKLKYLSLGKSKVTATGLAAVVDSPIEHVGLDGSELTEEIFRVLGKMPKLKELWISDAKFDPAWVKHLAPLAALKEFGARATKFDDTGAKHLAALPALEKANLQLTKLTDAGLAEVLKAPKLKSVELWGTGITKEAWLKAKKDHPKMQLSHYEFEK